ncbi:MAG: hypothetical protein CL424_18595 [Acidimicrobiaceae bacterium]|nr:hypothetical protein [Acidimicrobiaceae bacterium]
MAPWPGRRTVYEDRGRRRQRQVQQRRHPDRPAAVEFSRSMDKQQHAAILRDEELRPGWRQAVGRGLVVTVANALALWVADGILDGFTLDDVTATVLAGAVIGALNALVWPALAFLVVPLSVLTLGLGAIAVNAIIVGLALDGLPGVAIDGFWTALAITVGLSVVTTIVVRVLAIDDDAWFDEHMARRARRRRKGATATDVPGIVFLQIDGVAETVLRRAMASGDAPTLHGWLRSGSHILTDWETQWSSQTGVSQCGILHGDNAGMPAFRWLERSTGRLMVSNRPASAAEIERRHSDGNGLLAHHGSSYGNLFSGDAERSVLTMSGAGRVKEGRIGAGYGRYFARPSNALRSLLAAGIDFGRDRRAARDQRRRDVRPRIERSLVDSLLRVFTTVVSRDVCVNGVLADIAEGRSSIYVDLLGYDEVSHHSGTDRADTLGVLRDIDRQVGRIERAVRWAPRPYHLVVLSDHGQTQGQPFEARYGESLEAMVARLTGRTTAVDPDSAAGKTESTAWFRSARGDDDHELSDGAVTVLGSGALGLVYLPGTTRWTLEQIVDRYPDLMTELTAHPGIGFILVRSDKQGAVVLGANGRRYLDRPADDPTAVEGDDPLAAYGTEAARQVAAVDADEHVADLMINAAYDPETNELPAFEHQVGSHGALGGPQTHPFVLHPVELPVPAERVRSAPELHRVLKGWLAAVGQPVSVSR